MNDAPGTDLPAGDLARLAVRNAFWVVLLSAALFDCFAVVTTQVKPLRAHSPWQNDPYDAVVSFTMFFVPLVCGLCLVRVQLFRRELPLAIRRVRDLLRASALVLGLIAITFLADWISVIVHADRASWTTVTLLLIAMLSLASCVAAGAAVALSSASRLKSLTGHDVPPSSIDWVGDIVTVVDQLGSHVRPLGPVVADVNRFLRTVALEGRWGVRRHPLLWAGAMALTFGMLLALAAAREEGLSPLLLLFVAVGSCGMFAFLVVSGSFLGIVRSTAPSMGTRRRVIDALVTACASVPVSLGFRDSLWWVIGSSSDRAGLGQLAILLIVLGAAAFVAVLAVETALAMHALRHRTTR